MRFFSIIFSLLVLIMSALQAEPLRFAFSPDSEGDGLVFVSAARSFAGGVESPPPPEEWRLSLSPPVEFTRPEGH